MKERLDWDEYFLAMARVASLRVACTRAQHGAVVVSPDHRVLATGYNGATPGRMECSEGGCPRGRLAIEEMGHLAGGYDDPSSPGYCISVHAEANALLVAGRSRTVGATLYVTGEPCHGCKKLAAAAGIARIVY
jgi:dCMP deaminase